MSLFCQACARGQAAGTAAALFGSLRLAGPLSARKRTYPARRSRDGFQPRPDTRCRSMPARRFVVSLRQAGARQAVIGAGASAVPDMFPHDPDPDPRLIAEKYDDEQEHDRAGSPCIRKASQSVRIGSNRSSHQ